MPEIKNYKKYSIVSCATLSQELNYLRKTGFLNGAGIFYTAPGLHETPSELEKQLKRQVGRAKKDSKKVIVLYGEKCYVNTNDPSRDIDILLRETGNGAVRIRAKNCIDMLVKSDEREKISNGKKVYWLTPGWLKYWKTIFKDWDRGKANETFPQHDKAVLLDSLGVFEDYSVNAPEKLFEFTDWMRLNIEPREISLERLKFLLSQEIPA